MRSDIIGAKLIDKYDVLAPRYTSYPTAPQFQASFGEHEYRQHVQTSNASLLPQDLSIYLHVPFCHSLCYFCGCNKVVTQTNNCKVSEYLESLFHEITLRAGLFADDRLVTQIHFGGGTPNFLSVEQLEDILDHIAMQFHLDLPSNLEISIEIDPRSIEPKEIEHLGQLGFNRFSIGIQDFSSAVQKAINREQDEDETLAAVAAAMTVGRSVNVDLITGLPKQTLETFEQTLNKVIDTGVTRIAVYNFAYLPERIKPQRMIPKSSLPDVKTRLELASLTTRTLLKAGYQHIGMDHYALPTDSLAIAQQNNSLQRNFQGYTTHKNTDLIGIGTSAISTFDTSYSQNAAELSVYNEMVSENNLPIVKGISLNEDDRIRANVIQQIMCRKSVDLSTSISHIIDRKSDLTLRNYLKAELSQLDRFIHDGLVIPTDTGFDITEQGRYFMRPIAAIFDRYLNKSLQEPSDQVLPFSRTV
ncbi:MAG: oxygen-independent coproporphyrinogen-3 oxidase [Arenicella sp.]|jgi:oxygen-independent coproporphyrinogen-3 oxidase